MDEYVVVATQSYARMVESDVRAIPLDLAAGDICMSVGRPEEDVELLSKVPDGGHGGGSPGG